MIVKHKNSLAKTAVTAILVCSVVISAAIVLTGPFSHDEDMYLSAAVLLQNGSIYADFAYLQAPYMPYVYHWIVELAGSPRVLTTARLFKAVIVCLLILTVFGVCAALTGNVWFAAPATLLLFYNDIFRQSIPFVTNLDMATLLTLLAFYVYAVFRSDKRRPFALAAAGVLVGLAVGTKLTYALIPFCFLIPIPVESGLTKRSACLAGSFLAGFALALAPAVALSLASGIDVAHFNNIGYHRLNAIWRETTGFEHAMSFSEKVNFAKYEMLTVAGALLLLTGLFGVLSRLRQKHRSSTARSAVVLAFSLFVIAAVIMFMIPTPIWRAYLSTFVVALVLFVAVMYRELDPPEKRALGLLVWSGALLLFAMNGMKDFRRSRAVFEPQRWTGVQLHDDALVLQSLVPAEDRNRPVATLSPLMVLEAGLPIYDELATGQFAYRIGGLLSADEQTRFRTTSPQRLPALLRASPPSAILVGGAGDLDSSLVHFAQKNGYAEHRNEIDGYVVYVNVRHDREERGE